MYLHLKSITFIIYYGTCTPQKGKKIIIDSHCILYMFTYVFHTNTHFNLSLFRYEISFSYLNKTHFIYIIYINITYSMA